MYIIYIYMIYFPTFTVRNQPNLGKKIPFPWMVYGMGMYGMGWVAPVLNGLIVNG